jgi:hypothetical protein
MNQNNWQYLLDNHRLFAHEYCWKGECQFFMVETYALNRITGRLITEDTYDIAVYEGEFMAVRTMPAHDVYGYVNEMLTKWEGK